MTYEQSLEKLSFDDLLQSLRVATSDNQAEKIIAEIKKRYQLALNHPPAP